MPDISPNVVILTREELNQREQVAFQRGVERGKFEVSPSQILLNAGASLVAHLKSEIDRNGRQGGQPSASWWLETVNLVKAASPPSQEAQDSETSITK